MPVYVGLDCGGSSCRLLARNELGVDLFRGQSGPANLSSTPREVLERSLAAAAKGCPRADSVCGCFAGLVGEAKRVLAIEIVSALFPGAKVAAEADYRATLRLCPDADACVISGTGSVVVSMRDGTVAKSGGRGLLLGDEGSGAHIGRRALKVYLEARAGELAGAIEDAFGSTDEPEILAALYAGSPAARLARLVPSVGKAALLGNRALEAEIAAEMEALARVVQRHLGTAAAQPTIVLAGGVWKAAPIFQTQFETSMRALIPSSHIERLTKPSVEGAVLLAMDSYHGN